MECVWVMILFLQWSLSGAQRFDLEGGGTVVAAPGSDVTLPCSLKPRMSAVNMEVMWTRTDMHNRVVHHYKNKQDQTGDQDPSYRGKTSLFIEELQYGNTSLLLKKVQVSDGGQYRCQVDSAQWRDHISVQLKIEAVGGAPEITVLGTGVSGGVLLQCECRGWWPVPELQWLNSEGAELPAVTESCGDHKGFNVRLHLTAHKSNNNVYICRLKQGQIMMEKQIDITDHLPKPDYTAAFTVPIILFLLSALVGGVLYYRWRECVERGDEDHLRGMNFTEAQWTLVEYTMLKSEKDQRQSPWSSGPVLHIAATRASLVDSTSLPCVYELHLASTVYALRALPCISSVCVTSFTLHLQCMRYELYRALRAVYALRVLLVAMDNKPPSVQPTSPAASVPTPPVSQLPNAFLFLKCSHLIN
ncbi:butyrophilin subfamily 3 member A2-like [Brachyhypopomus gauderio]|uniref:butyrophilin subfamily 3 member A2-like n=1 Tax=Brachyhypopomus gauderio TaxID=698409 RepID=UPI004042F55A